MPRFVILYHQMPANSDRPDHWDLMLEDAGRLLTWALPAMPVVGLRTVGRRLPDHRTKYLSYEGSVSNGRGQVTRLKSGEISWIKKGADYFEVRLTAESDTCTAKLARLDDQRFSVEFSGDSSSASAEAVL